MYGLSIIVPDAQINLVFECATLIINDTLKYRIYLHNRCSDFANLEPIHWSYVLEGDFYPTSTAIPKFMVIPDW